MENKLSEQAAFDEIALIAAEFDIEITPEQREAIMPAVLQGRLSLDGETIVYKLARPTEEISELKFSEPTASQTERSGKGVKAIKTDKGTEIDVGEASKMITNLTSAITGQPIGFLAKLKRRDVKVIEALVSFFD